MRPSLDSNDQMPKYMRRYLANYGWHFNNMGYYKYISRENAYRKIKNLKGTTEFKKLDDKFKKIAVAFYLWCNKEDTENKLEKKVSEKEVQEEIKMW